MLEPKSHAGKFLSEHMARFYVCRLKPTGLGPLMTVVSADWKYVEKICHAPLMNVLSHIHHGYVRLMWKESNFGYIYIQEATCSFFKSNL